MTLTVRDLAELVDVAVAAATEAGEMISQSRPADVERKAGGSSLASQVVTEIDRRSEDIIVETLRPTLERFGLGLLTEEREDDRTRLVADAFWCVDPLDGTLPFIEGVPGYAVSIALVERDGTPRIGVVYDPVESMVWQAVAGAGVARNGTPWSVGSGSSDEAAGRGTVLSVFADRSFAAVDDDGAISDPTGEALHEIAGDLGLEGVRVNVGRGAVMNALGVLETPTACYLKFPKAAGGGSLWDFAATACLFAEVGAVATDIHGGALDLNRADSTFMHHRGVLFATDEHLAARLRALDAPRH